MATTCSLSQVVSIIFVVGSLRTSLVNSSIVQVDAEFRRTCALSDDAVKCWGYNFDGQLGYGDQDQCGDGPGEMANDLAAVDFGSGRRALQIATGSLHTCALLDDATVKCWRHADVRLGYGDQNQRGDGPGEMGDILQPVDLGTGRTGVQIATGTHTCALLDDATVKCLGSGADGRLGYGDQNNRGDGPGEMGDNLLPVDLGTGRTATQVAVCDAHSCALLDDATGKLWGSGADGRLGYGDQNNRGDGPGEMGNNLQPVDLGTGRTVVQIAAGRFHTCAVLDNTAVKCWGLGNNEQLGYGDQNNRGGGPGEIGNNL